MNPWYASEVYQNEITIKAWKVLDATKDSDYDEKKLEEIRCWVWGHRSENSAAYAAMGGNSGCTSAKLGKADAKDYDGKSMLLWFPQDYKFGDST